MEEIEYDDSTEKDIINTIKAFFNQLDNSTSKINRLKIITNLFNYMIRIPKMVAKHENYRNVLINKIDEIKADPIYNKIIDDVETLNIINDSKVMFNKFNIFLNEIKMKPYYVLSKPSNIIITI